MSQKEIDDFFSWRESQRQRHRVMNIAEYTVWARSGDAISSHTENNAFPGGLTVTFDAPPIIGRFADEDSN